MALADPNDPTRTSPVPLAADETAESGQSEAEASIPPAPRKPAPLQFRDQARYAVIAEHGRGGLGRVMRAHDRELGRPLAIKELLNRDGVSELRFFREAMITARLEHPGIVPVHEAGRWADGTPFYAMKLVAGRSLRDCIESTGDASTRLALLPHVVAIADAVAYAHSRRIIHRDLKPANVIVGDFGETIVIDWGLAKDLSDDTQEPPDPTITDRGLGELTVAGSFLGTPGFMAPEQTVGRSSRASDIYSLGALLFNVVTGTIPVPGGEPLGETATKKGIEEDLAAIIARATAHDDGSRYLTASEFGADLRRFLQREPVHARRYTIFSRLALRISQNRSLYAASLSFAILIALISSIAVVIVLRQREQARTAESSAIRAERVSNTRLAELTRAHALTLLQNDPTQSIPLITEYAKHNKEEAELFRAIAEGRGVAVRNWRGSLGAAYLLEVTRAGNTLTAGADLSMRVVFEGKSIRTITTTMSSTVYPEFSRGANLVAFVEKPSTLVIADPDSGIRVATPLPAGSPPQSLSIAGDGTVAVNFRDDSAATFVSGDMRRSIGKITIANRSFAMRTSGRMIETFATSDGRIIGSVSMTSSITSAVASDESGFAAVATEDGAISIVAVPAATLVLRENACTSGVFEMEASGGARFSYVCNDHNAGLIGNPGNNYKFQPVARPLASAADALGRYLVVGTDTGSIYFRDLTTGQDLEVGGHPSRITKVTTPTGSPIAFASADGNGNVREWTVAPWRTRYLAKSGDSLFSAVFSDDGRKVAAAGNDGSIKVWDLLDGRCTAFKAHTKPIMGLLPMTKANYFASLSMDGTVRAWDFEDGRLIDTLRATSEPFSDFDYTVPGTFVVTSRDGGLVAWRPTEGRHDPIYLSKSPLRLVEVASRDNTIAVANTDGDVVLIDQHGAISEIPNTMGIASSAMKSRESLTIFGNRSGHVVVYSTKTRLVTPIANMGESVRYVTISPDEKFVAVSTDSSFKLISMSLSPQILFAMKDLPMGHIAFGRDSDIFASSGSDGTLRFYSLSKHEWRVFPIHSGRVNYIGFSRDNKFIVSADAHGEVALTETASLFESTTAPPTLLPATIGECKERQR